MGFFSSKREEEKKVNTVKSQPQQEKKVAVSNDIIKTPTSNVSNINDKLNVKANIEGGGSLILGGHLEGTVKIAETLFIEKGARLIGEAVAKSVKISGDFEGTIDATSVEVTRSGRFNGIIKANKTFLGGFVDGVIRSNDSIEIFSTGIVDTKECKSKRIKINGKVEGRVVASELLEVTSGGSVNGDIITASELLEVTSGGSVNGDIITKGIRTEQGGSIIGNIQTYNESIHGADTEIIFDKKTAEDIETNIDPDVAKLIDIKPEDIQKYAKKDDSKSIKRIPKEKK